MNDQSSTWLELFFKSFHIIKWLLIHMNTDLQITQKNVDHVVMFVLFGQLFQHLTCEL